ncbi:aldehyde dehydrogenase family protein [Stutzerimonas xanthomarina]|uniref:aldehyde dehydrogenase family protein n=1 Tax=Stutzerimonas xanthomarina TaxID=271420 RepID=UPI003AA8B588
MYFEDIANRADLHQKAAELGVGFFNQNEVCTCPSRALVQESIYAPFMEAVMKKVSQIKRGDPLDTDIWSALRPASSSSNHVYLEIAKQEGASAHRRRGGRKLKARSPPAITSSRRCSGHDKMRVFRRKSLAR